MITPAPQIDLARREGWRTEMRDQRGRWTRIALGARDLTSEDRDRGNASLEGFRPLRFASDADAAKYLRRNAPRLPAAQRDAVTRYTGDEFYRMNRALRSGDASDPEVRRLDAAMRPSPDDMIVTRHVDDIGDARKLAGKKIADKAYASAALGSPYAGGLGGVTLHIAVPKGTPMINAAALSSNAHEREVILGRGIVMAVSRVVPNALYGHDAYAVVLPPAPGSLNFAQPTSTPPQQPGQRPQQPPPPPSAAQDTALTVAISELLLTAVSAASMIAALKLRFTLSAQMWQCLEGAATIAMASPPPVTGVIGPASEQTSRQNLARRAQFVLASARRLMSDIAEWRAKHAGTAPTLGPPEPLPGTASAQTADLNRLRRAQFGRARLGRLRQDIADAEAANRGQALQAGLARERRYYSQHLAAMWNRAVAAGKTDMAALEHGDLLGWNAILDDRVSPECRSADGKNYYASRMPDIGYPGAVHPSCRCYPSAPHTGGQLLWPGGRPRPARSARFARAS